MNKSNCYFGKKPTYDWLADNPSQDLFSQIPIDLGLIFSFTGSIIVSRCE
jgi:hypothetical protein